MIEMVVATLSTKVSLFLGTSPLPLPPAPPTTGIWAVLHEVRSEWAQLLVCAFLFRAGPGPISIDALLARTSLYRKARSCGTTNVAVQDAALPALSEPVYVSE